MLSVAQESRAEQWHDYTVDHAEQPAAVRFGDQSERSPGFEQNASID